MRHYRQPKRDNNRGASWAEQSAQSGGVIGQQQSQRSYRPHSNPPQSLQPQSHNYYHQQHAAPGYHPQHYLPPLHQVPGHHQPEQSVYQGIPVQNRFVMEGFPTNVCN